MCFQGRAVETEGGEPPGDARQGHQEQLGEAEALGRPHRGPEKGKQVSCGNTVKGDTENGIILRAGDHKRHKHNSYEHLSTILLYDHSEYKPQLLSCSTLTEALDRCKRKYQAKLRKLEQQMITVMRQESKIREEQDQIPGKNSRLREEQHPISGKTSNPRLSGANGDHPNALVSPSKTSSSKIPLPRLEGKAP